MANARAELLDYDRRWTARDIRIENDCIGPGYSIPSEEGNGAIEFSKDREGILLFPVDTSKPSPGSSAASKGAQSPREARISLSIASALSLPCAAGEGSGSLTTKGKKGSSVAQMKRRRPLPLIQDMMTLISLDHHVLAFGPAVATWNATLTRKSSARKPTLTGIGSSSSADSPNP